MNNDKIRMLAAIMFTDMVGYTALMQENEQKAKLLRDKHRDILEKTVLEHKGSTIQYYGDGALTIFGSAIEAVYCAVEIQRELRKEPVVLLRIGIHAGDIVYDDEGVYGDSVNIASRIENLALAGSVLISEKVYDEVKNHDDLPTVPLGEYELKNVKKPVEIYAVAALGLEVPSVNEMNGKSNSHKNSIAVLPFINMSSDPENEYFVDGVTEEILNALTKVDGLLVTSRTSTFAFKGKNEDIRKIGNQLGVSSVLEGSVRKFGDKVRITAQLINTSDGYHQWSEVYDKKLEDIFEIQDEISKAIATRLRERLSSTDVKEPLVKPKTQNLEAYNLLLKGRYYWNKWTYEDFSKAIKCYEKAFTIDPNYALPYVGLSNCYLVLASMNFLSPKEAYPKAKEYALKAMELDDSLSESHFSIGLVQMFYDWDWDGAYNSFHKALKINPGSADVHYTYSIYLTARGRLREALTEIEKAHTMDPLSLPINHFLAINHYYLRMYDEAIVQYKKNLELDPNFSISVFGLGWAYLAKKEYVQAIKIFKEFQKQANRDIKSTASLGYTYAKFGMTEKAVECLRELTNKKNLDTKGSLNFELALLYAGLKDYDKVFYYLDQAYDERAGGMIFLNVHPEWAQLKSDSRFTELIKRIGLDTES
jgi:adenylate cyclase